MRGRVSPRTPGRTPVPLFPKPSFSYDFEGDAQLKAVGKYAATVPGRDIPDKASDNPRLCDLDHPRPAAARRMLTAERGDRLRFDVLALHVGAARTVAF